MVRIIDGGYYEGALFLRPHLVKWTRIAPLHLLNIMNNALELCAIYIHDTLESLLAHWVSNIYVSPTPYNR